MSLTALRDGPLESRKQDRLASLSRRKSKLRALNAITTTLAQHCGLTPSLQTDFDANPSPPLTPAESQLLDENDLSKGRHFHDTSLPLALKDIEQNATRQTRSSQAASRSSPSPSRDSLIHPQSVTDKGDIQHSLAQQKASVSATFELQHEMAASTRSQKQQQAQSAQAHDSAQSPKTANPAQAAPSDASQVSPADTVAQPTSQRQARTVHLPPKEVQEQRIRERQQSREEARRRDHEEAAKASAPGQDQQNAELPSSPSSTVGAWSAATPRPGDPSPVTSAGDETHIVAENVEVPKELREGKAALEQHDSLLKAQKEIARRDALGEDAISPDVQLRIEEEQAAKATRDAGANTSGSAPGGDTAKLGASTALTPAQPAVVPIAESERGTATVPNQAPQDLDGDTIVVKPRPLPPVAEPNHTRKESVSNPAQTHRMTSRLSSGAIRHKSVSEIIADSSRNEPYEQKRPSLHSQPSEPLLPKTISPHSLHELPGQQSDISGEKRRASTADRISSSKTFSEGYAALKGAAEDPSKDYLEPLFRMQVYEQPHGRPLAELLYKASKAVSTEDQLTTLHGRQDHRILKRIYQLQNANRWSLRQMERCPEPESPKTHMDYLLDEMKWMRTDFREERKCKKALARYFAEQCAEWVNADTDTRQALQITIKQSAELSQDLGLPHSPAETSGGNGEFSSQRENTPGLEPPNHDHDDSSVADLETPATPSFAVVPSSIFKATNIVDPSFDFQESEEFHKAIHELPLYAPFTDLEPPATETGRSSKARPIPAVSKFCDGKILAQVGAPPRKRSRYDYEDEDEIIIESLGASAAKRPRAIEEGSGMVPEQTDLALFNPENKHIRDRLHANTAFRPPSEYPMPSTQFYEFRVSSQWIWEDDQKLRNLAKQYAFNWSLIADEMRLPSSLHSAPERRTPWECFERWVELETLPNEMRKTLYFKTWGQRLETAQRNVDARFQAQLAQQAQTPNQPQPPVRRRTQPVRVERRRGNRYLHLIDAMRKLARKREQHMHKQAEAQKAATLRKQHEHQAPKSSMHTPQEFSRLRHERDIQMAARQERYREQVLASQKAAQMQQRGGQFPNQQQGMPNAAAQQQRPGQPNVQHPQAGQAQGGMPNQPNPAAQMQARQTQQGMPMATHNGHLAVPGMGMQGNVPQAQMANMRAGMPNQTPSTDAQRIALQQRQAQYQSQQMPNQQYQMNNRVSPANSQGINHLGNQVSNSQGINHLGNNQAPNGQGINAGMQGNNTPHNVSGMGGNQMQQGQNNHQGNSQGPSASPHMPPPPNPQQSQQSHPQQLSSGHVPAIAQITHQIKSQNPSLSPEQVKAMTSEALKKNYYNQQARQNALNAASGINGAGPSAAPSNNNTPYNQNVAAFNQNSSLPHNTNNQYNSSPAPGPAHPAGVTNSPSQAQYSAMVRQRLLQQQSQALNASGAANGSPRMGQGQQHTSPNPQHASPNVAHAMPNMGAINGQGQRPPSRSATPQMPRLNSSGSVGQVGQGGGQGNGLGQGQGQGGQGMGSPALQHASPRQPQAGVARQ
ncbi:RNA polymerase II transcription elongation factor SpEAF [Zalaria obscura]|uniref:RNA polymerase II transcription elongation factor SpEAF n=1 Tax=Zalaria obscura TaxID=2024903 RepID=A0ACC3SLE1_9PEZI